MLTLLSIQELWANVLQSLEIVVQHCHFIVSSMRQSLVRQIDIMRWPLNFLDHLYTIDPTEMPFGYVEEGIACYVWEYKPDLQYQC